MGNPARSGLSSPHSSVRSTRTSWGADSSGSTRTWQGARMRRDRARMCATGQGCRGRAAGGKGEWRRRLIGGNIPSRNRPQLVHCLEAYPEGGPRRPAIFARGSCPSARMLRSPDLVTWGSRGGLTICGRVSTGMSCKSCKQERVHVHVCARAENFTMRDPDIAAIVFRYHSQPGRFAGSQ